MTWLPLWIVLVWWWKETARMPIGNTMNAGKIVVHGDAGDVIGYAMRGGKIYIRGDGPN